MDISLDIASISAHPSDKPANLRDQDLAASLIEKYQGIRGQSNALCHPLEIEDYVIQTMPDVSPPKWHLAHTSWFFETLILQPYLAGYQVYNRYFAYLFNSYYESLGEKYPRPQRGLLSRPAVSEVYAYRAYVDEAMLRLLSQQNHAHYTDIVKLSVLGMQHEQQHQELLLTDIKHILANNPLPCVYRQSSLTQGDKPQLEWLHFAEGVYHIGRQAGQGLDDFCYDNETPQHKVYLQDFKIRSHPVLNGEYMEFVDAGGYRDPEYWLSDAWKCVAQQGWEKPLYWLEQDGKRYQYSLSGIHPLDEYAPVCHVSFYEAAAFARWRAARLASEAEWEVAAQQASLVGHFADSGVYHPLAASCTDKITNVDSVSPLKQMFGDVWEWTQSAYSAYPGYRQSQGALGEYNGKFMSNQMVLRGGSCATPQQHIRRSYRNFFYPADRWQFSGFRLVEDVK